jgi:predicted metal-dependent hydrolase
MKLAPMKAPFLMAGVVSRMQHPPCLSETLTIGNGLVSVIFCRRPRARRYILRIKHDGILRVTIPRGGSKTYAQEFALRNAAWIQSQLRKVKSAPQNPEIWQDGTEILFRGERVTIQILGNMVSFADQLLSLAAHGEDLKQLVTSHLQQLASKELRERTIELAKQLQLTIQRVSIRSQRSRWGSCSTQARLSLNWRLIQTPPYVAEYIILHELMHLKEMNHSSRFWKCVAEVCPDYARAEAWLKLHGQNMLH